MKSSFFPDYILDDTLDDDASDGDNSINDNDDENYDYNSINNDGNHLNDNDDSYDSKYNNGNDDPTTMISHLIFVHVYVHRQILICLHSVNACLIYSGIKILEKS